MINSTLKIFILFILITNFLGCKGNCTNSVYQIVFERSKIIIPAELKEKPRVLERFKNSLPMESQIVIMDEDGKNQHILVREKVKRISLSVGYPIWLQGGKIFFLLFNELDGIISGCLMEDDGTNINIKELVKGEISKIGGLSLSQNGKRLTFTIRETDDEYTIYTMDIEGTNPAKITTKITTFSGKSLSPVCPSDGKSLFPVCSPDGKKILFVAGEREYQTWGRYKQSDIYIIDIDGKNLKNLTANNKKNEIWRDCWSPDGEKILYSSFLNDNYEIFVMDKDGNNKKRLTNNSVDDFVPIWSPDGKKIAYVSEGMLYIMDPDGKNQVRLTDKTQCDINYGIWSPDSKKIALVGYKALKSLADYSFKGLKGGFSDDVLTPDIYIINIEDRNLKNVTNTPEWEELNPSWRPMSK